MKFKVDDKVRHERYETGVVIEVLSEKKGGENYAVRFKKGGPLGWAENSTNDVDDLKLI